MAKEVKKEIVKFVGGKNRHVYIPELKKSIQFKDNVYETDNEIIIKALKKAKYESIKA